LLVLPNSGRIRTRRMAAHVCDADTAAQSKTGGMTVGTGSVVSVPARRVCSSLLAGDRVGPEPI
jgi:hypothetical protein